MRASPPEPRPTPWWRRRWVTVGELIGLGALMVALLGYCDAHRQRAAEAQRIAAARRPASAPPFVLTGEPADSGARLVLRPLRAGQVVQSQRYLFPREVLDHAMEVSAAQPQIDRDWLAPGLRRALAAVPGGPREGEGELPVGVVSTYLEEGVVRADRSLYRVGYRLRSGGLFSGPRLTLQGVALSERGVAGDVQARVDARWREAPGLR